MSIADKQIERIEAKMNELAHKLAGGGYGFSAPEILVRMGRYKSLQDERSFWIEHRKRSEVTESSSLSELPDEELDTETDPVPATKPPVRRRLPERPRGWGS